MNGKIDLKHIYANQVVIYKLLNELTDKLIKNRSRFCSIDTYIKELEKHADEVLKSLE
jgi:hypothetical protein